MRLLAESPQMAAPEPELKIKDIILALKRRFWIIGGSVLCFFMLGLLLCLIITRRFEAVGQLQVQKESSDGLGLDSMTGIGGGFSDALDATVTQQTQASILQSDTLALKVIKDLHLEKTNDFRVKPGESDPLGAVMNLIVPEGPPDPVNASLENSPKRRARILKKFSMALKVKPLPGTRLIEIRFLAQDPKLAADVVNDLMQGLVDYTFQTRYNATAQASGWLSAQLSDLRKTSENLEAKVVQLQREAGMFSLGGTDSQGHEQSYSSVLDKLQQATAALAQAQTNRILKGAVNEVAKSGDPELISGLSGTSVSATASAGVNNSLALIQNLRLQEATLRGQLDQLSAKFGPSYPKIQEIQANLNGVHKEVEAEVQRVAARANNDYLVAKQVEESSRAVFNNEKQQAGALNDKAIEYAIVRQEADGSRSLYDQLLRRLKEAGILEGLRSTNITVVDPGRVPSEPARPRVLLYLAGSIAVGLLFGCFGALLIDTVDDKIQNPAEIVRRIGVPAFGTLPVHRSSRLWLANAINVPRLGFPASSQSASSATESTAIAVRESPSVNGDGSVRLMAVNEPQSPYIEAVRALRTSLLLSSGGTPPQVILVTSSVAGEGKSMLAINLGVLLAQLGKKVLLVDADLRRPTLDRQLDLVPNGGLSSLLSGHGKSSDVLSIEDVPGLDVLQAGPLSPFPAELLESDRMRALLKEWRQHYDFIVFEGAPVLPVTDSVVLSTMADASLLLGRYKVTEWSLLERGYQVLRTNAGAPRVGIVINAVEPSRKTERYYRHKHSTSESRGWATKL